MNEFQKKVVLIIKSGITGEVVQTSACVDLENILTLAGEHQILPVVYYGITNSAAGKKTLEDEIKNNVIRNILISEKQMYYLDMIMNAFEENGLDHMPLKGAILKRIYPKPEMRVMGDVDVLIKEEQYAAVRKTMLELGFSEGEKGDHDFAWFSPEGLLFEMHKTIVSKRNKDYYACFGNGWDLARQQNGYRYRYVMQDEDLLIYLVMHLAKHYRASGIGIKHIVDIHILLKEKKNLDHAYIEEKLKGAGLFEFYSNVVDTLLVWFSDNQPSKVTDLITDTVFNSGSYGTDARRNVSSFAASLPENWDMRKLRIKRYFQLVFLSPGRMRLKYAFLNKAVFLMPLMWVIRVLDILLFKSKSIKKTINQVQAMDSDEISELKAQLDAVGLSMNI